MMINSLSLLLNKGYLLEQNREQDSPIPIFKTFGQLLEENVLPISVSLIILLLVALILIILKRKKQMKTDLNEPEPVDPFEEALSCIETLQSQRPPLSAKPFVFRLSEILRVYVERVFKVPAMELTGEEFMKEIASHSFFKNRYDQSLREFIDQGDQIKYSKEKTDDGQMTLLLDTALHFVKDTHAQMLEKEKIAHPVQS